MRMPLERSAGWLQRVKVNDTENIENGDDYGKDKIRDKVQED